jgi:hypothetical protein
MPKTVSAKKVEIPLKWHVSEEIISRFAPNIVVQTLEGAFMLSFFEPKPEIRLLPTDPVPTEVRAECVAQIIVPAEKLSGMIDVLKRQLDSFNQSKKTPQPKLGP